VYSPDTSERNDKFVKARSFLYPIRRSMKSGPVTAMASVSCAGMADSGCAHVLAIRDLIA